MNKILLLFLCTLLFSIGAKAQPNHVVISQIYGAGGNSGALFNHDFVELYNPTNSTVNLTGWSLQYSSSTGSTWNGNKVELSGSIAPGKYFLIQLDGGSTGNNLPSPDLSSTNISMSAGAGKLALINSTTSLTGTCPTSLSIIDFVGYGSDANCNEAANAPSTTALLAIVRASNGCTDNNSNSADFAQMAPSPRNSASPSNSCNGSSINISSIANMPFCVDGTNSASAVIQFNAMGNFSNTTFSVQLSDVSGSFTAATTIGATTVSGNNPSGAINVTVPATTISGTAYRLRIVANNPDLTGDQTSALEVINGGKNVSGFTSYPGPTQVTLNWTNPAGCFDEMMIVAKEGSAIIGLPAGDGTVYTSDLNFVGNGTAFDGGKVVYKGTTSEQTITGLVINTTYHFKVFTRRGTQWSAGVAINDRTRYLPQAGEIVINQFSPGFGAASDEYVEIVNTTSKTFDLSDLQFGYQSSTGGPRLNEGLEGVLKSHSYWLLSPEETISVGKTNTLGRDGAINDGFSATGGQIALLRKADGAIIDAVAYGNVTAGDYIEGAPATGAPVGGGLKRAIDGIDNNTNNVDFLPINNADIDLRNSSSVLANAGSVIGSGDYSRMYVTGDASLAGNVALSEKLVLINGILSLGGSDLTTASTEGGTTTSYVKTNGSGALNIPNIASDAKRFPVGNGTWNPLIISNGGGLNWSVRIEDAVQGVTSNKLVKRTWHITPSAAPATGATLVFEYNDGDASQISTGFNKNEDIQVWNFHDSKWQTAGLIAAPTGSAGGARTVTLSNWMHFSPFALANVTGPLPIRFHNEKAVYKNGSVIVSWSNLTEESVKHYQIERSEDGVNFSGIGTIAASKNNAGEAAYSFVDADAKPGKTYYRIKAAEEDGHIEYSRIMVVTVRATAAFTISPNPVQGGVMHYRISNLPEGQYRVRVYNLAGHVLHTSTITYSGDPSVQFLPLKNIRTGYYFIELSGKTTIQKAFIVE